MTWLGEAGSEMNRTAVRISTQAGALVALPGDWIVLTSGGDYHVARHIDGLARA